jgi:predicted DNA-binding antitoxin AbrB/MazE fold protein
MSLEIEGIYEGGVLKPDEPLPLIAHERVVITVRPKASRIRQSAGLIRWTGAPEVLRRIAEDPILDDAGAS